jgi:hypothetical protein
MNVNTYLDDPKDIVTLAVKMASLPEWYELCTADGFGRYCEAASGHDDKLRLPEDRRQ